MKTKQISESGKRERLAGLRSLLKETRSVHDHRRLLAIWMKAVAGLSPDVIAKVLLMRKQTVKNHQTSFRRKGPKSITGKDGRGGRGGRHRANTTVKTEREILRKSCVLDAVSGHYVISFKKLEANYIAATKCTPADSTIYRLLQKYGCHRIEKGVFTPSKP